AGRVGRPGDGAVRDGRQRCHRCAHGRQRRARRRRGLRAEPRLAPRGTGRLLGRRRPRRLGGAAAGVRDPDRGGARRPVRPVVRGGRLPRAGVARAVLGARRARLPGAVPGPRLLPVAGVPGVAVAQPQLLLRRGPAVVAVELVAAGQGRELLGVRGAAAGDRVGRGRARDGSAADRPQDRLAGPARATRAPRPGGPRPRGRRVRL
ncbi:MAG: hypothetical protein AVDCRST_MAG36-207, partial [uncultured Nocardioidaceae bacterium]